MIHLPRAMHFLQFLMLPLFLLIVDLLLQYVIGIHLWIFVWHPMSLTQLVYTLSCSASSPATSSATLLGGRRKRSVSSSFPVSQQGPSSAVPKYLWFTLTKWHPVSIHFLFICLFFLNYCYRLWGKWRWLLLDISLLIEKAGTMVAYLFKVFALLASLYPIFSFVRSTVEPPTKDIPNIEHFFSFAFFNICTYTGAWNNNNNLEHKYNITMCPALDERYTS